MERVISLVIFLWVITLGSFAHVPDKSNKIPIISFSDTVNDFGTISLNDTVICNFQFVNQGNFPLIISHIQTSCSCTISTWTRNPVKKNRHGLVRVSYKPRLPGRFRETIGVYSNARNSPVHLVITGFVKK